MLHRVAFRVNHEVNLVMRRAREGDYQTRLVIIKIKITAAMEAAAVFMYLGLLKRF